MKEGQLQVFSNSEFGELNVLEINGKPYFPATACAKILGYSNPRKAIIDHCRLEGVTKRDAWVQTGEKSDGSPAMRQSSTKYITEGNLYRLIVHSRLPSAERFESWVFDEVLPSIRRDGAYVPDLPTLIRETTRAVLQEVLPLLSDQQIAPPTPTAHVKRRRRKKDPGIVGRLDAPLREEIDDMILTKHYTYADLAEYLKVEYGIQVSRSAVGRYAQHLFDQLGL